MTKNLLAGVVLLGITGTVAATSEEAQGSQARACRVQGVWERVSTIEHGQTRAVSGSHQRKVVTKKHFMWLEEALRRDTLPLVSPLDSARYYSMAGGAGTYSVSGRTYTERLDFFVFPTWIGRSLTFSCRIEGNRWYHSYLPSDLDATASRSPKDSVTEVWQRIE